MKHVALFLGLCLLISCSANVLLALHIGKQAEAPAEIGATKSDTRSSFERIEDHRFDSLAMWWAWRGAGIVLGKFPEAVLTYDAPSNLK